MSHFYAGLREWISSEANQNPDSSKREDSGFPVPRTKKFSLSNCGFTIGLLAMRQQHVDFGTNY